jgi:hypothetical protein
MIGMSENIRVQLTKKNGTNVIMDEKRENLRYQGFVTIEHFRKGECIGRSLIPIPNVVTNAGKNLNLDVCFGATAKPTWYMGLMNTGGANGSPSATDTMSSHANWNESTAYDEATRPTWTTGSAASQQITNPSATVFTINATETIKGLFIATNNTKGGSTGTMWAAAEFSSIAVVDDDVLRLTYTLTVS